MDGAPTVGNLCRFFDGDRELFFRRLDAEALLRARIEPMLKGLHDDGLIKRASGYLIACLTGEYGDTEVAILGFAPTHSPAYAHADDKHELDLELSSESGFVTRHAQQVAVLRLRGRHTVYYGTFMQDGLSVAFSGVEAYWDEKIAQIAWALLAGLQDKRKDLLERVRRALGLSRHSEAMEAIERVADAFRYATIDEAVARIEEDAALHEAERILRKRHAAGEATWFGAEDDGLPQLTLETDTALIARGNGD